MKLQGIIHAPNEGLGRIADWASSRGIEVAEARLYAGDPLPEAAAEDLLVVMGGPMNIYQHREHPWLAPEKRCLARATECGTRVFGVCLGAQLLADVLGAKVYQNAEVEIGWFPVRRVVGAGAWSVVPREMTVFHWHGDTFEIPPRAVRVAESEGCANQAFVFGERVLGVQFHLEVTPEAIAGFIAGGESEMNPARYVQPPEQVLKAPAGFNAKILDDLLDAFVRLG